MAKSWANKTINKTFIETIVKSIRAGLKANPNINPIDFGKTLTLIYTERTNKEVLKGLYVLLPKNEASIYFEKSYVCLEVIDSLEEYIPYILKGTVKQASEDFYLIVKGASITALSDAKTQRTLEEWAIYNDVLKAKKTFSDNTKRDLYMPYRLEKRGKYLIFWATNYVNAPKYIAMSLGKDTYVYIDIESDAFGVITNLFHARYDRRLTTLVENLQHTISLYDFVEDYRKGGKIDAKKFIWAVNNKINDVGRYDIVDSKEVAKQLQEFLVYSVELYNKRFK